MNAIILLVRQIDNATAIIQENLYLFIYFYFFKKFITLTCLMQQIASPLKDGSKPLTYPFYPMERFTKVASYETSSWQIKIGIGTIRRIRHGNLQIMQWCQYATKTHVLQVSCYYPKTISTCIKRPFMKLNFVFCRHYLV